MRTIAYPSIQLDQSTLDAISNASKDWYISSDDLSQAFIKQSNQYADICTSNTYKDEVDDIKSDVEKAMNMYDDIKKVIYRLPNDKKLVETVSDGLMFRIYSIGYKHNSTGAKEHMFVPNFQIVYNAKLQSFSIPNTAFKQCMEFLDNIFSNESCNPDDVANNADSVLCNMSTSIVDMFNDGRIETYYPAFDDVKSHTYSKQKMLKCKQKFAMISW